LHEDTCRVGGDAEIAPGERTRLAVLAEDEILQIVGRETHGRAERGVGRSSEMACAIGRVVDLEDVPADLQIAEAGLPSGDAAVVAAAVPEERAPGPDPENGERQRQAYRA
jgi:hypothetical protein